MDALLDGDSLVPSLIFEMSNVCNASCIMCDRAQKIKRTGVRPEPYQLTLENLERNLAGLKRIRTALLCGGYSEPFLNKDISDIVYLLKRKYKAEVSILTNGAPLTRQIMEKMIYLDLDVLRLSIHGAKKETAESIMGNVDFERIIDNMREFGSLKRKLQSDLPKFELAFVGMERNIKEFSDMFELAKELGAVHVSLNTLAERQDEGLTEMKGQSLVRHPEILREEYAKARDIAKRYNIKITVNDPYRTIISGNAPTESFRKEGDEGVRRPLATGQTRYCLFPFEKPSLTISGETGLCCSPKGRYIRMGNAEKESFGEIWRGYDYVKIRKALLTGEDMPPYCLNCERAPEVSPIVLQMDVALRQLYYFKNDGLKKFVIANRSYYPEYVEGIKKIGGWAVPFDVIDSASEDREIRAKESEIKALRESKDREIKALRESMSWRITAPLRFIAGAGKSGKK